MSYWNKVEEKKRKNNNMKSNFSTTANFFVRIFFTLIGFNFWTNFIRIIWLNNLLMLFEVSSVHHSGGSPPPSGSSAPRPRLGGSAPLTPFNFGACLAGYLIQKIVRGKGKGPSYSSAIFSIGHFFFGLFADTSSITACNFPIILRCIYAKTSYDNHYIDEVLNSLQSYKKILIEVARNIYLLCWKM